MSVKARTGAPRTGRTVVSPRPGGWAALAAAAALVLAACTPTTPEPEPAEPTTALPTWSVAAKPRPTPIPPTWPLTGLGGEIVPRPALSVKVENSALARPQAGLEDADLVWEELVEGGTTRFNAVFHSVVPEVIGPIRSVRPMDAAISAPLGGLLAFSGGQQQFVQQVRDAGLQILSNDLGDPGFYRVRDRRAPHNLYGTGSVFLAQADPAHSAAPAEQLIFADDVASATAPSSGTPATVLDLAFPSTQPGWTWDPAAPARAGEAGAWARDERGAVQVSADGDTLRATNVVVVRVEVVDTGTKDPSGAPVPETVLVGQGAALVATGGYVVEGTWSKAGPAEPLRLAAADGTDLELAPGTTWIELVPNVGGGVSYQ